MAVKDKGDKVIAGKKNRIKEDFYRIFLYVALVESEKLKSQWKPKDQNESMLRVLGLVKKRERDDRNNLMGQP